MSIEVDLLHECAAAGIVFYPLGGKLRPRLTHGPISDELKSKVKANKERLLLFFSAAFDWAEFEGKIDGRGGDGEPPLIGSSKQSEKSLVLTPRSGPLTD